MNMISELRRRVNKYGFATISLEEYNQLQSEWITRAGIEVSENNPLFPLQYGEPANSQELSAKGDLCQK